jgi:hypothetical protein
VAAPVGAGVAPPSGAAQAATIHDEVASGAVDAAPAPSVNEILGATAAVGAVGAAGAVAAKPKAKPARKPKPVAKSRKAPDSDVVLLSALMAHVQSNRVREENAANSKANAAPAFKSCRKLNGRKAEQCRERICKQRAATDPACAAPAA